MQDPAWTKMAVVRDPLDRLRSAYLDKILSASDPQNHWLTENLFGLPFENFTSTSFSNFLSRVEVGMRHSLDHEDRHWQRQARLCDLGRFLPYYQHVFFLSPDKAKRAELSDCFLRALAKISPNPEEVMNFSFGDHSAHELVTHRTDADAHPTHLCSPVVPFSLCLGSRF